MNLVENERVARKMINGHQDLELFEGKILKMETSPNGEEFLNITVPPGKQWNVEISVNITEIDEQIEI